MMFQKRQTRLPQISLGAITNAQTVQIQLPREFAIESAFVTLTYTLGAGNTVAGNTDGLLKLLSRVQVLVADGANTRVVVDSGGMTLLQYFVQTGGSIDNLTAVSLNQIAAYGGAGGVALTPGTYAFTVPIFFSPFQLEDPASSAFLLPAPTYNTNPILQLSIAGAAELTSGTVTACTIDVLLNRRQVAWAGHVYIPTDLIESSTVFTTAQVRTQLDLPVPGSYLNAMIRGANGGPTNWTNGSPISGAGVTQGEISLQYLNTEMRRGQWGQLMVENQQSIVAGPGASIAAANISNALGIQSGSTINIDFISDKSGSMAADLGSTLDTNPLQATGNRVNLLLDVAANSRVNVLVHRAYGDLGAFKFRPATRRK